MSYENTSLAYATTSSLSEFVGPSATTSGHPVSQARQPGNYVAGDTFDWTTREVALVPLLFGLPNLPLGPASTLVHTWDPLRALPLWEPFIAARNRFLGFKYDAIRIRITINNPKGIVGGLFVGWYPYLDYFDEDTATTTTLWLDGDKLNNNLLNSCDCQLMSFGDAQDVVFTIPWTFKNPLFMTRWLADLNTGTQNGRPPAGFPVCFVQNYTSSFVSTITNPAQLQVFAEYVGMEFYGPGVFTPALSKPTQEKKKKKNRFQPQMANPDYDPDAVFAPQMSGMEVMGAAAVGVLVEKGISTLVESINPFPNETDASFKMSTAEPGNFDNPSAVQLSFFGDTTSQGPPQTRPVFMPGLPIPSARANTKVMTFLSRPAFIRSATSNASAFVMTAYPAGNADYMNYFSMVNRYWRGTINYHIVITGHPMVQCKFTAAIFYQGMEVPTDLTDFNNFDTHQETFYGSKTITIPMPFLTPLDYLPCVDEDATAPQSSYYTRVVLKLEVVSTMLNVQPVIPFFVFRSAGDDFIFAQPYPPGLYYSPEIEPPAVDPMDERLSFSPQIGIPQYDHAVMQSRSKGTKDPGTLPAFTDMLEYMQTWSRSVPFNDYNNSIGNEEPIPDARVGYEAPCWFPPVDRARDYNANNSWYFSLDYVHYFSILFLYYRGSISTKVVYNDNVRGETLKDNVLFVTIDSHQGNRLPSHCAFLHDELTLPPSANFGAGTFATSPALQPVMEATVPMRSFTTFANCIPQMVPRGVARLQDLRQDSVRTNILLYDAATNTLCDQFARKVDSDFVLAVESTLPPWTFWGQRGSTV